MRYTQAIMALAMLVPTGAAQSHAGELTPILVSGGSCGWYVVLGCGKRATDQQNKRDDLGGPNAGGGAGLRVITTNDYANFRPGYYCVVDGPYANKSDAQSIAWAEAVPDAYVKKGC
ncbi:hypothetical protein [Pararhizobium antarcticum]|uniref:Uncharacterized protein n=1 Tax=Pararhizobium antarcticum TaxID=1798805 RepID=A0A657LNK6_9HYPH|nr:hypothetical protein [Pararhizobium antarcticum]OJF93390.1 hypothetical protein AX760_05130 [Pararhizobium antarcticum]OJF95974.1 hypothetical protein AX761_16555 [Rhizobium sp. 58]